MQNLLPEPPATRLPADVAADAALTEAAKTGTDEAYKEVAAALDMPIGTIGPTRQRCLGQLRQVVLADQPLAELRGDV